MIVIRKKTVGAKIMFSSRKKQKNLGRSVQDFETILGKTVRIDGNVVIKQSLRIDGCLNGNILQEDGAQATVAIGPEAKIIGDVRAHHIIIAGSIQGNIFTSGKIELVSSAQVEGDITYGQIGIEIGSIITGKLLNVSAGDQNDQANEILAQMKQKAIA
jgi:cytoskeletal protein CcmA (bactofilin family)